jgi:hypothetical protein
MPSEDDVGRGDAMIRSVERQERWMRWVRWLRDGGDCFFSAFCFVFFPVFFRSF